MSEITLPGCTPEPLMSYLKALGILRLVAEQRDPEAKGCWRDGVFVLRSSLDEQALLGFFLDEYKPTPVFAPWNGDGGFLTDTGRSMEFIDRLRKSNSPRLSSLKGAVNEIDKVRILVEFKTARADEKELRKTKEASKKGQGAFSGAEAEQLRQAFQKVKEIKESILFRVRGTFPDDVVRWLDACLAIQPDGFSSAPLFGSGGCDGRLEFSANYLGNVLQFMALPPNEREGWAEQAILNRGTAKLVATSVGQLSPGQIGGPNGTQGFEGDSLTNPLDFILMVEGGLLFGGSVSRKYVTSGPAKGAFPFTVYAASVGRAMDASKDSSAARGEMWLPLWSRFAGLSELTEVLAEGRAEASGRQAASGVQLARALASLGVDRGINGFTRYGFLQRNGKAYLATALGRFDVQARPGVDLIREIDPWLDRFRRAASDDKAPPRFSSALRRIESAIFDFCQYGGPSRFGEILCALGQSERELSTGEKFRKDKYLRPLCGLSPGWLGAADDQSAEFEIALALSGLWDRERKVEPLRSNLEPARAWTKKEGGSTAKWTDAGNAVVWTGGDLAANLSAVLERRLLDGKRLGCTGLPLSFHRAATLAAISAFIHGEADDDRIAELLWGMILIDHSKPYPPLRRPQVDAPPLPRAFALLRLLFLPHGMETRTGQVQVKPEARVLALLRAGRIPEACAVAARRLRASGLDPMPHARGTSRDDEWDGAIGAVSPSRLAAALLIPVSKSEVRYLVNLVSRPETMDEEAIG